MWGVVALTLGLVAVATLVPTSDGGMPGWPPFWCLWCGDFALADAVANVVLFAPLGWALSRTDVRPGLAIAGVMGVTIAIEFVQHEHVAGRVASVADVLMNTVGGVLGMALPRLLRWLAESRGRALRGAVIYGVLLAVSVCAGVAIQAIPEPAALRWTAESPKLPGYTDFTGSVAAVRVNGTPLARLEWREVPAQGGVEIEVDLVSGPPDPRRAEIISARRRNGPAWMWVDQHGSDLRVHVASASDDLRLRGHSPSVPASMPAATGQAVTVQLLGRPFAYRWVVRTKGEEVVREASISPGDGWRLFTPFERLRERWASLLTGLWMAALLAPLGYLAAGRSGVAATAAASGAVLGLVLLPVALACAWLPLAGWCGSAGGFVVGVGAARR